MKILCTNHVLEGRGGTESYLETVAPELRNLDHEVVFFTPVCGLMAQRLRDQGFQVVDDVNRVPADIDVIHGQHLDALGPVRARFRDTPLVFVTHSWFLQLEDPARALGADRFVALNDRTRRRLEARDWIDPSHVVRLRQPVSVVVADLYREPIRQRPQTVLLSSRNLTARGEQLAAESERLGLTFRLVGSHGHEVADSRLEMMTADVVLGVGRTALEGMALGRAVCILDEANFAGWVDERTYDQLEADGFTSSTTPSEPVTLQRILEGYDASLGTTGRMLAATHHPAPRHAVELVQVYRDAIADRAGAPSGGRRAASTDLGLIGALAGQNWSLAARVGQLERSTVLAARDADDERRSVAALRAEVERLGAEVERLGAENGRLRAERVDQDRRLATAERHADVMAGSLSWRVTAPLRTARSRLSRPRR